MKNRSQLCRNLALGALAAAAIGYLTAPAFLGFTVLPLVAALPLAILAGKKAWRPLLAPDKLGLARLKIFATMLISLGLLLAASCWHWLPAYDFSQGRTLILAPETVNLLAKMNQPVTITVHLGSNTTRQAQITELMEHYLRAAPTNLTVTYINAQTQAAPNQATPRLVKSDTAQVTAEGFRENVSPVSEGAINGALARLLHPQRRLVYFLNTYGEKLVQDQGQGGLSQWAEDLGGRRFLALDYYWPENAPLPQEAAVLVLAGPKAPLGEPREKQLQHYVKNGGHLLILADPLTASFSPEFWAAFGLKMPDGLMIDPEKNLAGTSEEFVVSHNYPLHPLTVGLTGPVLWPLAGAFVTTETDQAIDPSLNVFAVALSSAASWLETDLKSLTQKTAHYQPDQDLSGPLALAAAVETGGGGRLLALADSDLAANGFRGFPGNRNFTLAAINWLADGESTPLTVPDPTHGLILNSISARLIFWLPVVAWPALIMGLWLIFFWRRHQRSN